jgi:tetratricopeptide (TPR) repeat protein
MFEAIMQWQWWILAAIVAVWFLSAILSARRAAPDVSSSDKNINSLVNAHDTALLLIRTGDFADAEAVLADALERIPPPTQCTEEEADLRFRFVLMLASVAREWRSDLSKELELLNECADIVTVNSLPPPSVTEDRLSLIYMMYMNRAIAAGKLKLHLLEEESLSAALEAAVEPSTKCKCLAYQAWSILYQKDLAKIDRIESIITNFDLLADQCKIPSGLASQIRTAEVMVRLHRNDVRGAGDACARAVRIDGSRRLVQVMMEILIRPEVSAAEALDLIWQALESKEPKSSDRPLSPLPPEIAGGGASEGTNHRVNDTEVSEEEFRLFESQAIALQKSGQNEKLETLARAMLARPTRSTIIRGNLLHILARAMMRQDRTDEALRAIEEAIRVAHSCNDATMLVWFLDARAEILCFAKNYIAALRTAETAEKYVREADIRNGTLECWLSHTKGIAYSGCGWWQAAKAQLQKAIDAAEHLRDWTEWTGATGDFVGVTLHQTEAEGPDEASLEDALRHLVSMQRHFGPTSDRFLQLQVQLDSLRIRSTLAIMRRDIAAMWRIQDEFTDIMKSNGGQGGFFNQPGNSGKLIRWTVDYSRLVRALIEIQGSTRADIQGALEGQLRLLERATDRAPRSAVLWQEKAALHLFRARCGFDDPAAALMAAADCAETVMDIMRVVAREYDDARVRAGWLGTVSDLFEMLGEIGEFALSEVFPPSRPTVCRIISLAQYLRARSRRDIARILEDSVPGKAQMGETDDLVTRIRFLHRWLETKRMPASSTPHWDVSTEITRDYPEYSLLITQQEDAVENELRDRTRELHGRIVGNSLLRISSSQIEEEAPFDLPEWQDRLGNGEVVLDYYVGPRSMYAAILSRSSIDFIQLPVSNMRHLHDVAGSLSPDTKAGKSLAVRMRECSGWLFPKELVDSIQDLAPQRVYIVVSGPLWSVPFPWLDAAGRLVLQRWETCLVPSARLAGSNWSAPSFNRAFAVGHPGMPPYKHLSEAKVETDTVASLMDCSLLFNADATPREVLNKVLPNAEIVHFACHGECDPVSPLASALLLQPDGEHPDGRLMLYEILGASLRASIVSLGACRTAKIEGPSTFPESLAHAFLGGGAQYVVASLWDAFDEDCLTFAENFYGALTCGSEPAAAFRDAQLRQAESIGLSSTGCDYGMLDDHDFSRFANFVLLSARKQQERNSP